MEISGKIVDVIKKNIFSGKIIIENKKIKNVIPLPGAETNRYILPGFIDAHVHIESSMLTPVEFGRMAVRHGTTGVVADPHEIVNVMGVDGLWYMISEGEKAPVKIRYGVPSCVPATSLETSGASIDEDDIEKLFRNEKDFHLAEMMNYPGVIHKDEKVIAKLKKARKYNRIVDGHAPGLTGNDLMKYAKAGIKTDHECTEMPEALEKINTGMHILIREGSAAKNLDALMPLIADFPEKTMFCTDDSHPDDLAEKHIRNMVLKCLEKGYDFWNVLRTATMNPVKFYGLRNGLLQKGDAADFIVCDNLKEMNVLEVFVNGRKVYENGTNDKAGQKPRIINRFEANPVSEEVIRVPFIAGKKIKVMGASEGSLLTETLLMEPVTQNGMVVTDLTRDVLKIIVVNRYRKVDPVVGFVKGFGLKNGALASSIAHDSHNLIAVGSRDDWIVRAVNTVIDAGGGIAATVNGKTTLLPLPVAGLMSTGKGEHVARKYGELNRLARKAGSVFHAPFMTLSFMALLVIPELKIGDKGLFDVNSFGFTDLWV